MIYGHLFFLVVCSGCVGLMVGIESFGALLWLNVVAAILNGMPVAASLQRELS